MKKLIAKIKRFINYHRPRFCWQMWLEKEGPSCIVDDFKIIQDEIETNEEYNKMYNDNEKIYYKKIVMSLYKRDKLPDFQGF